MAKVTRKFSLEEIDDLIESHDLELPYDCRDIQITDSDRWALHYEGVFELDGEFWKIHWQKPATEMQECDEWFDNDYVMATRVVLKPLVREVWMDYDDQDYRY